MRLAGRLSEDQEHDYEDDPESGDNNVSYASIQSVHRLSILLGSLALCLSAPLQLLGQTCSGGNCTAASLSTSDVQACINSTTAGHTCTLPAGSATWTSGVTVNKAITVQGAGAGRIVAYAYTGSALAIGTGSKSLTITGSTFVSGTPPATAALTAIPITTGQTVRLSELGFRSHFMQGTVSSWNSSTGALTLNVTSSGGTCGTTDPNMPSNCKRWLLSTIPATVIAHNVSGIMWNLTEATTGSMYISGIKFATGSGTGATIYTNRTSGGQAIVIHDCWIENINGIIPIDGNTDRGLFYNDSIDNSPFSVIEDIRIKDPNNTAMPTSWTTVSTFGTNDTAATPFCSTCLAGQNNQYIENVDFHAGENVIDWDDNARGVVRYSFFDNAGMGSHGADTSEVGVRHFEIYNNVGGFVGYNDGTTANMNWWLFTRGGTTAMHDNVFPTISSTDYGTKSDVTMPVENLDRNGGQHPCWGEGTTGGADYYAPRQNGFGRVTGTGTTSGSQSSCPSSTNCTANHFSGSTDAYTYVGDSEPVYIWNNRRTTGGSAVNLTVSAGTPIGQCTSPDSTSNYVVAGRDYFDNGTVKPSYTAYTYPHPLAGIAGHYYSTTFPLTENPIMEGGAWLNGATTGIDWDNVQTTANKVFGTGIQGNPPYNDSTASLTGTWGPDQEASAVLYLANGSDTASQEEVELRLNTAITAHSITGYECDLDAYSGGYAAIVRWNGPVNNFTQLAFAGAVTPIHNGDTFKCTKVGSAITMYINGASILSATDSTYSNGSPGVGFWQTGGTTAMLSHYGFSSFTADDTPGTTTYTLTTATTGTGSGTITSCAGTYTAGDIYSCNVAANAGSTLTSVSGCGGSGTSTYTGNMPAANCTVTANFTLNSLTIPTPTFSPVGGAYVTPQAVTISDSQAGVTIHYTTDGSTPTGSSPVYSAPITVSTTSTVKAIAKATGYTDSLVGSASYTIGVGTCSLTFSPAAGTYTGTQNVTITQVGCPSGTQVFYRTDGLPATVIDTKYTAPIPVSSSQTLTALAAYKPTIRDQPQTLSTNKKCNAVGSPITFPSGYSCNNGSGGVAGTASDFKFTAGSTNQWYVSTTDSTDYDTSVLHIDTPSTTPDTAITAMSYRNVFQDSSNCGKDAAHLYQCIDVSEFDAESAKDPITNALWQMSARCSTNAAGSSGNNGFLEGDASSHNEKWDIPCVIGALTDVTINSHWTQGDTGCGGAGCMVLDSIYLKTNSGALTKYDFPASCDASNTYCPNYPMTAQPTYSNFTAGSQQQLYARSTGVAGTSPLTTTRNTSFLRVGVHEGTVASGSAAYSITTLATPSLIGGQSIIQGNAKIQ